MTTLVAKTVRNLFGLFSSLLLTGCATQAVVPAIRTMEYVDLDRFAGRHRARGHAEHFEVVGDTSTHYGEYPCGPTLAAAQYAETSGDAGVSCC